MKEWDSLGINLCSKRSVCPLSDADDMEAARELAVEDSEQGVRGRASEPRAGSRSFTRAVTCHTSLTRALSVTCDPHSLVRTSPASSANSARPLPVHRPLPQNTMENEIDGWIAQLSQCKQLSEPDVKRLCDMVRASCTARMITAVRHQGPLANGCLHPDACDVQLLLIPFLPDIRRGRSSWSSQTFSL